MCFWKKRYNPSIIDIVQYEKDLLYQREHGIRPRPPRVPTSGADWSTAELEAMRDNRQKAQSIYDKYRGE